MTRSTCLSGLILALVVSAFGPAVADTYLVYTEGGIPLGSDIATWCHENSTSGACDERPVTTCATPEGGTAWRARTVQWAGFGFHRAVCGGTNIHCWGTADPNAGCINPPLGNGVCELGGLDLSAYATGDVRFYVKSKVDVEVGLDCNGGGSGYAGRRLISNYGWQAPAPGANPTWQEIVMPVCSFFPNDQCTAQNIQCLSSVVFPFLATIAPLNGLLNEFQVDNVRWETPNTHPGASTVEIQGRQLIVNGEPFVVNGVAYNPVSPCEDWRGAWRDRPDRYMVDFPLIAASGSNVVRVYAPVLTKAMLDAAWAEGLYVIPTFPIDLKQLECAEGRDYQRDRLLEQIAAWKDHPAILLWLIGNEVNLELTAEARCQTWYPYLDSLAQQIHAVEGAAWHPVGTANADSLALGDVCQAGCSDDLTLPNLDLWAVHLYRGCTFGAAFNQYDGAANCDRPLIVGEFGMDAWDSMLVDENQALQASCLDSLLAEADQALAVRTPGGVSTGHVVFEWSDEWWKSTCSPEAACDQDTCQDWFNGAYPDPAMNEEWWGIVSQEGLGGDPAARGLRSGYDSLSEAWQLGAVCNMDVVGYDAGTGEMTLSFDPAAGSTDHALYYGPLAAVSTYGYSGAMSGLGATGSSSVTLPGDSLFWVMAAQKGATEGCYGVDAPAGAERPCYPDTGSCSVAPATYRSCTCNP